MARIAQLIWELPLERLPFEQLCMLPAHRFAHCPDGNQVRHAQIASIGLQELRHFVRLTDEAWCNEFHQMTEK